MGCLFQDEASPPSLTDLCLSLVSSRLELFCVKLADGSLCLREPLIFPQELADQLLCKMATEGEQKPESTKNILLFFGRGLTNSVSKVRIS